MRTRVRLAAVARKLNGIKGVRAHWLPTKRGGNLLSFYKYRVLIYFNGKSKPYCLGGKCHLGFLDISAYRSRI